MNFFGIEIESFVFYDLILLFLFIIFLGYFLYKKRDKIDKEGLLLLYRTKWGIRLINKIGKKYKRLLNFLSYISVGMGYLLMAGVLYLIGRIVWIYIFHKEVVQAIKIPPIMPLVPYLPQMFKLDFLYPFYFTYWIVIIAIIAITHEFAHGIFASKNGVKIKTTGFGFFPFFLPIFLAAFVEPDEKQMSKGGIFKQLTVLSAGTFANTLTAIFFFIILVIFFSISFYPAGITYGDYAYNLVDVSTIIEVNGIPLQNPNYSEVVSLIDEDLKLQKIKTENEIFPIDGGSNEYVGFRAISRDEKLAYLYYDSPAINENLEGIILKINGERIVSREEFFDEFQNFSPGDEVTLTVMGRDKDSYDRDIILGENPQDENMPFLGVQFLAQENQGFISRIYDKLSFREQGVYYQAKFDGISDFVYYLLWWLIIISISVALINMLPVGIFDGGRFFYLTVLAITKSEIRAKKLFSISTYFFLFILLVVMIFWVISFV